jgi:CRP/FNR family transcriptional regulator, anaerobic regulatory protein
MFAIHNKTDNESGARPQTLAGDSGLVKSQSVNVNARELARMLSLEIDAQCAIDGVSFTTRRIAAGETLFRSGDPFHSLYVVRSGFFKLLMLDPSGTEQVLSFPMQADVMGGDGLASGRYGSEAIAIEDAEVIIVPFSRLVALARQVPQVEQIVYSILSRELVREQAMLYVIGTLHADARVAAFLLDLSRRFAALGYSRTSFNFRMTRQEIGSYLGLKLETVSRALSSFDAAGLIKVHLKEVEIRDEAGLKRVVEEPIATPAKVRQAKRAVLPTLRPLRNSVFTPLMAA